MNCSIINNNTNQTKKCSTCEKYIYSNCEIKSCDLPKQCYTCEEVADINEMMRRRNKWLRQEKYVNEGDC